jgi:hypothetical protein
LLMLILALSLLDTQQQYRARKSAVVDAVEAAVAAGAVGPRSHPVSDIISPVGRVGCGGGVVLRCKLLSL